MALLTTDDLTSLMLEGRFKARPTIVVATLRAEADDQVLFDLVDPVTERAKGECAASDIPAAIEAYHARLGETFRPGAVANPNLAGLAKAFDEVSAFLTGCQRCERKERQYETRKSLTTIEGGAPAAP